MKKRFGISSPTTSLPEAQFIELRACIEEANHILRSLGNPPQPENPRQLQLKLDSLMGDHVSLKLAFRGKFKTLNGILVQAGRNYVQLREQRIQTFVLYEDLISVTANKNASAFPHHEAENPYFNEELNCELLYHFSETVSGSVKLLNRFFGIPLSIALLQQVGKKVHITQDAPAEVVSGVLFNTTDNAVIVQTASTENSKSFETIPFDNIELIRVMNS
ncbi:hypothetical protein ACFSVM_08855 [Paenibacillus shunpengii]|uniref:Uncharacterized protein n=1 Tax=Paenibacillus shunpengii TaxID=2054424 RepID=A0ABW5SMR2_9BACL